MIALFLVVIVFSILPGLSLDHSLLPQHLFLSVLMILFLHIDFSSQLFKVLVGLLEDLKKSGVLLSIDHIDVGVEVIVLEGLNSVPLVLVLHHLLFLFLRLKRCLY